MASSASKQECIVSQHLFPANGEKRAKFRDITKENIKQVKDLYLYSSLTNKSIAESYGLSSKMLKTIIHALNLPSKRSAEHPLIKKKIMIGMEMMRNGESVNAIKKKLKSDPRRIKKYLNVAQIPKYNGSFDEKIISDYSKKSEINFIKNKYNVSSSSIYRLINKRNIPKRVNRLKSLKTFDEIIVYDYIHGKNAPAIAKSLKLPLDSVYDILRKALLENYEFKLLYRTQFASKWKTTVKTYHTLKEIEHGKRKLMKFLGDEIEIAIKPILSKMAYKDNGFSHYMDHNETNEIAME